jgi:hypothetical protein
MLEQFAQYYDMGIAAAVIGWMFWRLEKILRCNTKAVDLLARSIIIRMAQVDAESAVRLSEELDNINGNSSRIL